MFLDADAILEPTALHKMREVLDQHQEVVFVYSAFYFGWKLFPSEPFDAEKLKDHNFVHTSSLIRREAFPGFDESLKKLQDWDLWLTIVERGGQGMRIQEPLLRVQVDRHRRSRMSTWMPKIMYRLPWPILGFTPATIQKYHEAEQIVRQKHQL